MTTTNTTTYSAAERGLHWAMAALLAALAPIGWLMSDADPAGATRLWLSRAHAGLGMLLGVLLVVRIVTRLRAPKLAEVQGTTSLQRLAMRVVHVGLYVAIALVIASGNATSLLGDWPAYLLGSVATAPDLHPIAPREGHEVGVFLFLALTVAHVGGVMLHEVRKGGTLRGMLPGAGADAKSA